MHVPSLSRRFVVGVAALAIGTAVWSARPSGRARGLPSTLVVLGDPQVTTTAQHPRGAMLRAYDKQTGQEVGAVYMPAPQSGSPMTYKGPDGRQYIVVAVSGGNYSGEYLAFALPESEVRPSTQQ